jgi:hypothetical protein
MRLTASQEHSDDLMTVSARIKGSKNETLDLLYGATSIL